MDEPYIVFNRQRLKDVVLYICSRCDPSELGNVKLHKILYFADMLKFQDTGSPLTGDDYIKQKFGPTARHLGWALNELARDQAISVKIRNYYGFEKKDFIANAKPSPAALGNGDPELLDAVIDFVCQRSAREISELSHDAAWRAADLGERIPYAASLGLEAGEITDSDRRIALADARRLRPLIEAERRESQLQ